VREIAAARAVADDDTTTSRADGTPTVVFVWTGTLLYVSETLRPEVEQIASSRADDHADRRRTLLSLAQRSPVAMLRGDMGSTGKRLAALATTLSFEKFWRWLAGHANCILRAGTPEAVLLDHDDFHWTLITEDEHTYVVQLARAKDLVGELLVFPAEIAYVQVEPGEVDGEWLFECIVESEKAREVAYHFVMAHEYEDGEHRREEKWTH